MDIQRKAFEAYMADRYKNTVDQRVCINSDGDYMAWDMQVAWHVWQAAKASMPEGFVLVEKTKLMQIVGSAAIIEPKIFTTRFQPTTGDISGSVPGLFSPKYP